MKSKEREQGLGLFVDLVQVPFDLKGHLESAPAGSDELPIPRVVEVSPAMKTPSTLVSTPLGETM